MRDILLVIAVLVLAVGLFYTMKSMRQAEREAYEMRLQLKCMEIYAPKK